jgi:hypothetical protein
MVTMGWLDKKCKFMKLVLFRVLTLFLYILLTAHLQVGYHDGSYTDAICCYTDSTNITTGRFIGQFLTTSLAISYRDSSRIYIPCHP